MTLIMGGNLLNGRLRRPRISFRQHRRTRSCNNLTNAMLISSSPGGRGGARVEPSVLAGVVVVRYVLLPLVGTGLVKGAVHLGLVQPDPLYQFILMLQYAVPPAMNIGEIFSLLLLPFPLSYVCVTSALLIRPLPVLN